MAAATESISGTFAGQWTRCASTWVCVISVAVALMASSTRFMACPPRDPAIGYREPPVVLIVLASPVHVGGAFFSVDDLGLSWYFHVQRRQSGRHFSILTRGWLWNALIPMPVVGGIVVYAIVRLLHQPQRRWRFLLWLCIAVYWRVLLSRIGT
ncbi:hypothetical protein [Dyella tabacisoli]|uniref:hypothetical protein n=1 Tax=Dyella tabacisoli TaxID=2282381 RepID=UPI0013B38F80|nr:hypothetical protein [Dyella tabacisoli]